ncbi:Calmodulin [Durusdinium trenchii]|uniref:Calmodulin n=1 Tax=Durusdinium trenchii TaxID=1381693 RepID=A0ABP0RUQ7_9DINO
MDALVRRWTDADGEEAAAGAAVAEGVSEVAKQVANDPMVGLFRVHHHVRRRAVPEQVAVKDALLGRLTELRHAVSLAHPTKFASTPTAANAGVQTRPRSVAKDVERLTDRVDVLRQRLEIVSGIQHKVSDGGSGAKRSDSKSASFIRRHLQRSKQQQDDEEDASDHLPVGIGQLLDNNLMNGDVDIDEYAMEIVKLANSFSEMRGGDTSDTSRPLGSWDVALGRATRRDAARRERRAAMESTEWDSKQRPISEKDDGGHRDEENCLVTLLCCPFRIVVVTVACLLYCVCCPFLFCCEVWALAFMRCCCNPSLKQMESFFGKPLWMVVLIRAKKMSNEVNVICSAVFSHPDFDAGAMRLFDEVDTDQSGVVDADELEQLIERMPANIALTKRDTMDISNLYKDYTGGKTKLTREDWPIFVRCIFALIIANAVQIHNMARSEVIIMGITGDGRASDVEKGSGLASKASIHEIE